MHNRGTVEGAVYGVVNVCHSYCCFPIHPSIRTFTNTLPTNRSKDEMYRHLSIDVDRVDEESDPWSVQQGVDKFFQPDCVNVTCEKCDTGRTATQTRSILQWYVLDVGGTMAPTVAAPILSPV